MRKSVEEVTKKESVYLQLRPSLNNTLDAERKPAVIEAWTEKKNKLKIEQRLR